jgi:hypothetical protein
VAIEDWGLRIEELKCAIHNASILKCNPQSQFADPQCLSPPGVHFEMRVFLEESQWDIRPASACRGAFFGAAICAPSPHGFNQLRERLG